MSIQVENNLKNTNNKQVFEQKVHYMPCHIDSDGEANVNKYFEPYVKENDGGDGKPNPKAKDKYSIKREMKKGDLYFSGLYGGIELSATFRGHSLVGSRLPLPDGYRAVVVTEAKRPLAEEAERRFQVAGGFKEFVNWNWDKKPTQNDNILKALDWMEIAEAIHGD